MQIVVSKGSTNFGQGLGCFFFIVKCLILIIAYRFIKINNKLHFIYKIFRIMLAIWIAIVYIIEVGISYINYDLKKG
jgi:uncharacterized membrane protein YvlD (DUF360 family)